MRFFGETSLKREKADLNRAAPVLIHSHLELLKSFILRQNFLVLQHLRSLNRHKPNFARRKTVLLTDLLLQMQGSHVIRQLVENNFI